MAGIGGPGREGDAVVAALAPAAVQDLQRRLVAEIGHDRDAVALAARDIEHVVMLAEMRHRIEGEGDQSLPAMGDAIAGELRPDVAHEAMQDRGRFLLVDVAELGPARENDASAVG